MVNISLNLYDEVVQLLQREKIPVNLMLGQINWVAKENTFEYDTDMLLLGDSMIPVDLIHMKRQILPLGANKLTIRKKQRAPIAPITVWKIDPLLQKQLVDFVQRMNLDPEDFFSHIVYENNWLPEDNPSIEILIKTATQLKFRKVTTGSLIRAMKYKETLAAMTIGKCYKNVVDYEGVQLGLSMNTLYKHIEWTQDYDFICREEEVKVSLVNGEVMYLSTTEFKKSCLGEEEGNELK